MIGIFLGSQSSGKTLSMVAYAYDYYKKGYSIYSNFSLKFKHQKITQELIKSYVEERKQFNKAVFIIDEIYLLFDSRSFGAKGSKIFSYFLLQTSKRGVILLGTAQRFNTVDLRFRENCIFKCYCNRTLKINNDEFEFIMNDKRKLNDTENENLYIKQTFIISTDNMDRTYSFKNEYFLKAKKYFNIYDTTELLMID